MFNIEDCDIYANTAQAEFGRGGGLSVYANNNNTRFTDVRVYYNSATLDGGGIMAGYKGFTMDGGELHGNTAGGYGGGLYIDTPQIRSMLIGVKVTHNHAGGKGGGFYVKSGIFRFDNPTEFLGNTATLGLAGGGYLPRPR